MRINLLGLSRSIPPKDNKHTNDMEIKRLDGCQTVTIPLALQVGPG